MKKHTLILLNGGIGARVSAKVPKQLIKLNGIPMVIYSLVAADAVDDIDQIIINYPSGYLDVLKRVVDDYAIRKEIVYVPAGGTRQESVRLLLEHCLSEYVLIHESARPFVSKEDFEKIMGCNYKNVSFMTKIPFTVALVDLVNNNITGILDRELLRNVQLPQRYETRALFTSHENALKKKKVYTDDSTLCADFGISVNFIEGNSTNIKITNKEDIKTMELMMRASSDD